MNLLGNCCCVIGRHRIAAGDRDVVGLSARGAAMRPGDVVVEVDMRNDPAKCFGFDARGAAIAHAVVAALAADANIDARAAPMIMVP